MGIEAMSHFHHGYRYWMNSDMKLLIFVKKVCHVFFCFIISNWIFVVEQLKKIQEEHLKQQNNAIFADDIINERLKNYELEIDKRCQELNELFNRMHSILQHFQALKANFSNQNHIGTSGSNRMISTMIRNIFQYQVQEVCNLTQLFRSCQRVYVDRRNEATKVDPEFVITFDEDLLKEELANNRRLIDNTFDDSVYLDLNQNNGPTAQLQSQTQLALDDQIEINSSINAHLKEREREMNSILKSFVELNQIFREVNALVVDQGSALDRIDYNLEQVEQRVEMGAVILEKAHRNITRVRKLKIVLGAGLLIFLLLLFIIIRS